MKCPLFSTRGCVLALFASFVCGCASPYHADQGALFGGLTGAGVGALVGNAVGHTGAGAAIGAGVGALSGAAIGSGMDEVEARNRAQIAAQLGRQVPPGAVTLGDVVNMSHAGISDNLIVTHVQRNGLVAPLKPDDLIYLKQQGVSDSVIQMMQSLPSRQPVVVAGGPPVYGAPPVVVEEHYYGEPYYYYRPRPYHYYYGPPRTSFGFSVSR